MSITSKTSSQRRNDSGELVVFEAARYFSGGDENACYHNSSSLFPHNLATAAGGRATAVARMSLDMPAINRHNLPTIQKQYLMREKKKYKQPSSPGGRLASFLNSLFNQTNSKKKKKSKKNAAAADNDDGEYDHRTHERRRSSISHFGITTSAAAANYYDSNSTYSAAVTPPSHAKTPTKSSYLQSFSDRQKPHKNGENDDENERFRFDVGSFRNPRAKCTADDEDQRKFGKVSDGDDGEDSDSSSDLFDLPNLDFYSSGLPVFGTTDMDRIRIGAPISTV